jgi:hypothetical protein
MEGIKAMMQGNSPPKKGPLSNIDQGGFNIGISWVKSMQEAISEFSLPLSSDNFTYAPPHGENVVSNETTNSPIINIYYQGTDNKEADVADMARQFSYAINSGMY